MQDAKMTPPDINEVVLVGGQTRMPMMQQTVQRYFGKEPHKGINPDEVVAVGAAIQAGVLGGEVKDILLLDVTPLTLGIETLGQVMTPLIERNTTIPYKKSQTFSTAADMQTQVEVHVLQGERPMAPDNKTLGKFNLDGIPPARRGMPQIEVTFDIDADGILHVSAKDQATGREQKITITASSGLNKDEVDKMVKEAQKFADEDRKRKEEVEIRNNADSALYQSEKMLRDLGDKVPADVKTEVEAKITALKNVKDSRDPQEVKRKTDELAQTLQKIGERMYQQTGGAGTPPPPGGEPPPGPKGSDTVDGEFREVKE